MALIKCPECGQDVSDKAKMCPHCGYELPAASQNVSVPLTETETEPFGELASAAPQAAAPTAKEASTPSAADKAEVQDPAALWRKDCHGEYIFGVVYKVITLLGMITCIILFIVWLATVGAKIFADPVEEVAKHFAEYDQKTNDAMIVAIMCVVAGLSGIFDDLWKPYRVLAWSKRTNFEIRYYVRKNPTDPPPPQRVEDFYFYGDLQYISGSAKNSLRYRLWKITDGILDSGTMLLVFMGIVLGVKEKLQGAFLLLDVPQPAIMWALPVAGVVLGIANFILKKIMQNHIKEYLSELS